MLRLIFFAAFLQCTLSQQYQQKVAPGVPPQNYQQPPPPPPPQQQQPLPPSPQQQQSPPPPAPQQQPPPQQYQPPPPPQQQYQQVPVQQQQYQQVPVQQQQVPIQQQQVPVQQVQMQQQVPQQQQGHAHLGDPQLLNPANIAQERDHIQEHMDVPIDTSKMSEQELQFHYFKMHDADNNNKLDGCELIKSLIHWHGDEKPSPHSAVYKDEDLIEIVEGALKQVDKNNDGYIEYTEFRTAALS